MKNLITYLKALWSWVSDSQRKKIGVTLGEATIEHPFSTYSAPFGTCWQPSGKLHSVVRCAAMLVMLFIIGSGNAWGDTYTITFATNSGDGTKASTSTAASTCTTAATYVTGNLVTASNVYYGGSAGLKLGTKSGAGDIKINLSTTGQVVPTKVSVYAKYYSSSNKKTVQLVTNLGSTTATTTTGSFTEYSHTYSGSTKLSYIEIKSSGYIWVEKVVVTYAAAPSYTVNWTINPAAGGTLSTTSGTSTTVTPNSAYTYGSPAYTVTTGSATVSQSTNTFTATPSANCTIRINMVEKPKYTITYNVGSGTCATSSWTQTTAGQSTTLPTATPSCDGWSFAGWCTSSAGDEDDNTTSPGTILTGSYTPTSNVDLYAVYTKTEGGGSSNVTFNFGYSTDWGQSGSWSGTSKNEVSATKGGVTVTYTRNGTNLYANSTSIRFYPSNTLNFACSSAITAITFTVSTYQTDITSDVGTCTATSSELSWTGSANSVTFTRPSGASSYAQMSAATITITSGTTYYMTDYECAATPTITVSKTAIEFGDKKVGGTYTETFTVSGENLTGAINLAVSGAQAGKYSVSPATLSPTAGTVAETTITVTFAPTASSDHAAQVDITSDGATPKTVSLHAISKWEVTWKNDGAVYRNTLVQGGQKPEFPTTPTSCDTEESNLFYGWTDAEWAGKIDDVSAKTIHKSNATMPNASNNTTIYYAVFVKRTGSVDDYTDNLTRTTTGISSGSSYGAWSGKSASNTGHSSAVYAGQSAGGNDAIQLRATSPSGMITTTSGGKAKKVTVVWNSNTADGRTLDIYGKNAAYEAASDLYAAAATTQGTKIGSIVYGTSTELTITDDYEYIGIRSNSNALYLDKISIDWQDGEYTYSKYMTNCCDYYITVAEPTKTGTGTGTVAFASGGSAVTAGSDVATCAGTTTITATVTPNPGHQCDALSFTGGSVSVSPAIPDPFVPFDNAGATTYTLTFAQNTNATLATAVTFTQLHDYYIDYMHDNAKVTKNGNYGTAPSLSSTTPGDGCAGSHYKFVGWVPESDMNMNTGVPTTTSHMVAGGQAGMYATGTNYYAIWAEEVTP